MLGLTQQQMAELIGVTYQQAHKYEKGINRIAAGRLFTIAQALGVDVGYFFDGMDSERSFKPTPQQRMLLELARNFISMPSRKHQEAHLQPRPRTVQPRARGRRRQPSSRPAAGIARRPAGAPRSREQRLRRRGAAVRSVEPLAARLPRGTVASRQLASVRGPC